MLQHAQGLGFRVEFEPLAGYDGLLLPGEIIVVNSSLIGWRQNETIAHELGHAWHGHAQGVGHRDAVIEHQADEYAARLLISPTEYALAESLCEHPGAIAKELGVSRRLVEIWQSLHKNKALALR